jgi:hypothetical protein
MLDSETLISSKHGIFIIFWKQFTLDFGGLNTIVGWVLEIAPNPHQVSGQVSKLISITVIKKKSNTRLLISFFNYLDAVVLWFFIFLKYPKTDQFFDFDFDFF